MKETKELILFLAAVATQAVESSTDGDGLNFRDAPDFLDELIKAPRALAGIHKVPKEIHNSTPEDRRELYLILAKKIDGLTPGRYDGLVKAAEFTAAGVDMAFSQFKRD
jgi:hypothetical protein